LDERLAEKVDVLPVNDHFERRRIRPVGAVVRDADEMGRDRLVAVGVEFGPGLRQLLDSRLLHGLGRAPKPVDAVDVHRRGDPDEMPITDPDEQKRLEGLYEGLRVRLLDLSRKNQLLNYNLRPRSKRSIQIIGCSLEDCPPSAPLRQI
jgi:hypothetical protein